MTGRNAEKSMQTVSPVHTCVSWRKDNSKNLSEYADFIVDMFSDMFWTMDVCSELLRNRLFLVREGDSHWIAANTGALH